MRLHGSMRNLGGKIAVFQHQISFSETFLRIAEDVVIVLFNIVGALGMDPVFLRLHGVFGIKPGGEQFILDVNQIERLLGNAFAGRYYTSDIVSNIADLLYGKGRFIMADRKNAVFVGRVRPGDDRHYTLKSFSAGSIDFFDQRVRIGRMQDLADEHSRQGEVVSIFALSGGLARRVDEGYAFADYRELVHLCSWLLAARY